MNSKFLNAQDAADLSGQLRRFLSAIHANDRSARNSALQEFIDSFGFLPESPITALEAAYRNRDTDGARASFRKALGIALREANPDTFPSQAAVDLIYMVGFTEAFEALPSFVIAIGDVANWGEAHESLFVNALAVLKGLGKSPDAYDTTAKLLTSPRFPHWYILDAYEALVIGNAANWASDFLNLCTALRASQGQSPDLAIYPGRSWFRVRIDHIARNVIAKCSLATIASGLSEINNATTQLSIRTPTSDLLLALFGPAGPLEVIDTDDQRVFRLRASPSIQQPWLLAWDTLAAFLDGAGEHSAESRIEHISGATQKNGSSSSIVELLAFSQKQAYRRPETELAESP